MDNKFERYQPININELLQNLDNLEKLWNFQNITIVDPKIDEIKKMAHELNWKRQLNEKLPQILDQNENYKVFIQKDKEEPKDFHLDRLELEGKLKKTLEDYQNNYLILESLKKLKELDKMIESFNNKTKSKITAEYIADRDAIMIQENEKNMPIEEILKSPLHKKLLGREHSLDETIEIFKQYV